MGTITVTVRSRTLIGFALGAVTMLIATAVWMSAWSADAAPGDSDTTVVPITSCRLTDTRPNFQVGPRNTPLGAEETYPVEVQNASTECVGKVPASATGLLLNVTAVQTTQPTFLSIWDEGPFPGTSSLNPVPGPPVPNAVTTKLADDDTFRIYNRAGTTHVIIDIVGYLTPISLQELAATAGTPGPKGDKGDPGADGAPGTPGAKGDQGDRGFSAWDTIPSGQTVTGSFYEQREHAVANQERSFGFSVSFPAKAPQPLTNGVVNFASNNGLTNSESDNTCTGTFSAPTAPSGKVCIYLVTRGDVDTAFGYATATPDFKQTGFEIDYRTDGSNSAGTLIIFRGSWAYTAP